MNKISRILMVSVYAAVISCVSGNSVCIAHPAIKGPIEWSTPSAKRLKSGAPDRVEQKARSFPPIASYEVVDLMPAFFRFWAHSSDADTPARVRLFRESMIAPNQELFAGFTGNSTDKRLARYLTDVKPYIPAMQRFYQRLQTELPLYGEGFKKSFPDAKGGGEIYLMPNLLGSWDAGGGDLHGRPVLVFGVDSIVQMKKEGFNLATFFHHELFHMYYATLHPELANKSRAKGELAFYQLLWNEGLATYVSKVLNPGASTEDILLSPALVADTDRMLPELIKEIRQTLTSTSTDTFMNFLSGRPVKQGIPPRCGYYVGMLIARELARKHSLPELARLGGDQLLRDMKAALLAIESNAVGHSNVIR